MEESNTGQEDNKRRSKRINKACQGRIRTQVKEVHKRNQNKNHKMCASGIEPRRLRSRSTLKINSQNAHIRIRTHASSVHTSTGNPKNQTAEDGGATVFSGRLRRSSATKICRIQQNAYGSKGLLTYISNMLMVFSNSSWIARIEGNKILDLNLNSTYLSQFLTKINSKHIRIISIKSST